MNNKKYLFIYVIIGISISVLLCLFFLKSASRNMVMGPGHADYDKHILDEYYLYRTSSHDITIHPKDGWNDETPIIPSEVLQLNIYKDYILAYRFGTKSYIQGRDTVNNPLNSTEKSFDYWILDVKNKNVYKFMSLETYNHIRDSLKIPEIKLIAPSEY